MLPDFTVKNYLSVFEGCLDPGDMCVTFKTYLSTFKFCLLVWLITLLVGFTVAYFVAFHVRTAEMQTLLFCGVHHSVLDVQRHPHDRLDPCWAAMAWSTRGCSAPVSWTSRLNGCCSRTFRWCWRLCTCSLPS